MTGRLEGTFVVVVAEAGGATRAGELADELRAHGGRVAVFAAEGDASDTEAIVELAAELGGAAR